MPRKYADGVVFENAQNAGMYAEAIKATAIRCGWPLAKRICDNNSFLICPWQINYLSGCR